MQLTSKDGNMVVDFYPVKFATGEIHNRLMLKVVTFMGKTQSKSYINKKDFQRELDSRIEGYGYTVTEELKKNYPNFYKILTEIKVRYQFIDKDIFLENWAEMIQLDEEGRFKQVRFSPRLDFVPLMDKEKLELYYSARKKISELYNSDDYRIEFKLQPGDLLMMDNHRLLHGRTTYDANEGNRFLQGCYIDYDSTEGKLKHLKRKFNL